jgi:hypothetical protein
MKLFNIQCELCLNKLCIDEIFCIWKILAGAITILLTNKNLNMSFS